jgi:hypothetical protein
MTELKPLPKASIPRALEKAKRYRLLNTSYDAESICLDILAVEADHQEALIMLILSLTDQFVEGIRDGVRRARGLLPRLTDEYHKAYYAGIICERQGKAKLKQGFPGAGYAAYESFHEALACFEKAQALRPDDEKVILRWNTCVRIMSSDDSVRPGPTHPMQSFLE